MLGMNNVSGKQHSIFWRGAVQGKAPRGGWLDPLRGFHYPGAMREGKSPRVNAVHRGLQILELLAGQRKGWSTSEISRRLKIPKSTTSYLLHTLLTHGYLRREEDSLYRLSMKLLALGS